MPSSTHIPSSGTITKGLKPNTLADQTIDFIESQLTAWRDDKTREETESEEDLNGQLCKFLDARAREDFPMACFNHEEKQGMRRRVDMSATPSLKAIRANLYESIYEPFLVIEGKRLPAPTVDREREYLTGHDEKSGGVQRFRLCLHGQKLSAAVVVGYVQSGHVSDWLTTINGWITDLSSSGKDSSCAWTKKDHLGSLKNDGKSKASRCNSKHGRTGGLADLTLTHLWVCVPPVLKARKKKSA